MTAYPPAQATAPATATGDWLRFSAAMTAQVPPISGRDDLTREVAALDRRDFLVSHPGTCAKESGSPCYQPTDSA